MKIMTVAKIFVLLLTVISAQELRNIVPNFNVVDSTDLYDCPNSPTELDKVDTDIYLLGRTQKDKVVMSRVCSWSDDEGFDSKVVSVNFHFGSNLVEGSDGQLICECETGTSCDETLTRICVAKLAKSFLDVCCLERTDITYETCIEAVGGQDKIDKCLANELEDINPKQIALDNTEAAKSFLGGSPATEPFFTVNGVYDYCTNVNLINGFAEPVCNMLKNSIADSQKSCQEVAAEESNEEE